MSGTILAQQGSTVWVSAREIVGPAPPVVVMEPYNVRAPGVDQPPSQVWPPGEVGGGAGPVGNVLVDFTTPGYPGSNNWVPAGGAMLVVGTGALIGGGGNMLYPATVLT